MRWEITNFNQVLQLVTARSVNMEFTKCLGLRPWSLVEGKGPISREEWPAYAGEDDTARHLWKQLGEVVHTQEPNGKPQGRPLGLEIRNTAASGKISHPVC